ncbi:MAG: protein-glutamate O-methyltransferase CheR [Nitrospirae bacterium]|nr:protein-glutamate O-methyltransferase CheR [Nitrospirota bacterium]
MKNPITDSSRRVGAAHQKGQGHRVMGNARPAYDMEVTDQEFELFQRLIYNNCGINLTSTKKNLLQTRLMKRLKLRNCETFSQYYRCIKNDPTGEEMIAMLNAISTNLTKFFREEEHFTYLNATLLPELILKKRKGIERKLRVWCAGCSSGEEAYSLGITVLRHIETPLVWNIKILATDISTNILEKAADGAYEADKISDIPKEMLTAFFIKGSGEYNSCYIVKPALRDIVTFRRLNLIEDNYPFKGKFDFIFCRNVMIYFDKKTQEGIVNRFYNYLEDDGYLFIGHSESLNGVKSPFKYVKPAVYRKEAS